MHHIFPDQQEKEPYWHREQQYSPFQEKQPIGVNAGANAANQRIDLSKASALNPREGDNINETDDLQYHCPWDKDTKTTIKCNINQYGNSNENCIHNRELTVPILLIAKLLKKKDIFHGII